MNSEACGHPSGSGRRERQGAVRRSTLARAVLDPDSSAGRLGNTSSDVKAASGTVRLVYLVTLGQTLARLKINSAWKNEAPLSMPFLPRYASPGMIHALARHG